MASKFRFFLLAWLVWAAAVIAGRAGEATAVVGGAAVGVLVTLWTLRGPAQPKRRAAILLGCLSIIPANLSSIVFDVTLRDPTSHNLAPFEMIFSAGLGSLLIVALAMIAPAFIARGPVWKRWPGIVGAACAVLLLWTFATAERVEPRAPGGPIATADSRTSAAAANPPMPSDELRALLLSGTEIGTIVKPSGKWEGDAGSRYRARYEKNGRMRYTAEGHEEADLRWRINSKGALCRGPEKRMNCRFVHMRAPGDYRAVGYRSGKLRYKFAISTPSPQSSSGHFPGDSAR